MICVFKSKRCMLIGDASQLSVWGLNGTRGLHSPAWPTRGTVSTKSRSVVNMFNHMDISQWWVLNSKGTGYTPLVYRLLPSFIPHCCISLTYLFLDSIARGGHQGPKIKVSQDPSSITFSRCNGDVWQLDGDVSICYWTASCLIVDVIMLLCVWLGDE